MQYNTIKYNAIQLKYNTITIQLQYKPIKSNTIQYNKIQYNTITIQYNTIQLQYNAI